MNIALFLNNDFEASVAYNLLKAELSNHTLQIFYSSTVGNPANKPSDLKKLEYYERDFFYGELNRFIKEHQLNCSFEFFDENFKSFPLHPCSDVNSRVFIDKIKAFDPHLFLSIRFGKIFKEEIIQIPKYGLINLHSALLPDYKGILGTLHALKDGKKIFGCTLHTIPTSGIDTGEIIDRVELDVHPEKSLFWHLSRLYPLGAKMLIKAVKTIENKETLKTIPQNLNEGNYFSIPTEKDFKELKQSGYNTISIIDYLDVLAEYVLPELTENQKNELRWFITRSKR